MSSRPASLPGAGESLTVAPFRPSVWTPRLWAAGRLGAGGASVFGGLRRERPRNMVGSASVAIHGLVRGSCAR